MSKTLKIISNYFRLLNEQGEEEQPNASQDPAATPDTAPVPEEPAVPEVSEGERTLIKILINAFLFNPKLFSPDEQEKINDDIDRISKSLNRPVPAVVDDIKKLISKDSSLKLEKNSKFLSAYKKYTLLLREQDLDATEPNVSKETRDKQAADPETKNNNQQVEIKQPDQLELQEIFPMYKELIIRALKHVPTSDDFVVKSAVSEFMENDPEKVVELIKKILDQSPEEEDNKLEDDLADI